MIISGKSSFGKVYDKLSAHFYSVVGFGIVSAMMLLLSAEELYRFVTPKWTSNIYMMFYYVVGMCAELFGIFYIISLFYKKEKFSLKNVWKQNIWDLLLLGMFGCILISVILADDRVLAMQGTDFRNEGLYTILVYVGLYVSAKAVTEQRHKLWLLRIWGFVVTFLSVPTFMQYFKPLGRLAGSNLDNFSAFGPYASLFKNTNHFAYVLTLGIVALAVLVVVEQKRILQILALIAYGCNIWALIINNTLGSYLGVLFGILGLCILMSIKDKKYIKLCVLLAVVFVGISACMMSDRFGLASSFRTTYKEVGSNDNSAGSGRIGLWKQGVKYVEDRPVFGYGPEGSFLLYFEDGFTNDRPHNEYLQHAIFFGVPAAAVYLLALISMCIYCVKRIKQLHVIVIGIGAVVLAYCVSAFFGNTMYYTSPYFFSFLGLLSGCHKNLTMSTDVIK